MLVLVSACAVGICAMFASWYFTPNTTLSYSEAPHITGETNNNNQTVEPATSTVFVAASTSTNQGEIHGSSTWKYPELRRMCACESTGDPNKEPRQFDEQGNVVKGWFSDKENTDWGMCQISDKYWLKKSQELGYDIFTREGNLKMAEWLYEAQGTYPWRWSKSCHGL